MVKRLNINKNNNKIFLKLSGINYKNKKNKELKFLDVLNSIQNNQNMTKMILILISKNEYYLCKISIYVLFKFIFFQI